MLFAWLYACFFFKLKNNHIRVWNGLIHFTLFLIRKENLFWFSNTLQEQIKWENQGSIELLISSFLTRIYVSFTSMACMRTYIYICPRVLAALPNDPQHTWLITLLRHHSPSSLLWSPWVSVLPGLYLSTQRGTRAGLCCAPPELGLAQKWGEDLQK